MLIPDEINKKSLEDYTEEEAIARINELGHVDLKAIPDRCFACAHHTGAEQSKQTKDIIVATNECSFSDEHLLISAKTLFKCKINQWYSKSSWNDIQYYLSISENIEKNSALSLWVHSTANKLGVKL